MSTLDSNDDQVIDRNDEQFDQLQIWRDLNQDGVSSVDELQALADFGIEKIHLDAVETGQQVLQSRILSQGEVELTDGSSMEFAEVGFAVQSVVDQQDLNEETTRIILSSGM